MCGLPGALQDIDSETVTFSRQQLIALWLLFGDISIDDRDLIEEEFLGFKVGTNRFEIQHWFDERFPGGVVKLMDAADKELNGME